MPRLRHLLTLTLGTALLHLPSVQAAEELPAAIKQIEIGGKPVTAFRISYATATNLLEEAGRRIQRACGALS